MYTVSKTTDTLSIAGMAISLVKNLQEDHRDIFYVSLLDFPEAMRPGAALVGGASAGTTA
jgi:hypothetical protein